MVRFIGMVGQSRRNFTKMASWSRTSEHLVNPIGMSDQLKWNNQQVLDSYPHGFGIRGQWAEKVDLWLDGIYKK